MTSKITMSLGISLLFSTSFASIAILLFSPVSATTTTVETKEPPTGDTNPKPGTITIVTFVIGTTKVIKSDSTNIQAVNGGYFIADSSIEASQPLQSKTISKTVLQQLVSVLVDVSIVKEPPPTSSEGCGEGFGYYVDDPKPICEPLDKIGQGPPPDQAFCAALGYPYNPPNLPDDPSPEPESPTNGNCGIDPSQGVCLFEPQPGDPDYPNDPVEPEPQPEPESNNDEGLDGENNQNQNEDSNGGDSTEENDSSGEEESTEE